jgi:predicted transcriptional regulator
MYMGISLTPELDRLVKQRLATGAYPSEEAVLQAALLALDVEEQSVAAIQEGHADFVAGRYRPFDEADAEFRDRQQIPRDS